MWSFSSGSMNTVMKNNKALLRKRVSIFKSKKDYIQSKSTYDSITDEFFDYKTASPELLEEIRKKYIYKRKKSSIINISLVVLSLFLCFFLTFKLYLTDKNSSKPDLNKIPNRTLMQFNLIIKDADEWMEIGNFENAIFQYNRASKLIPNQFAVEYRICLGYSYLCRYDQKECEKGKEILQKTLNQFPNKSELLELKKYF